MVYLIGTGPGDEELLTLKAVRTLKKCTAVLYDRLGANNILNYVNEDCKIYYCGKEPGAHYKTQEEINESLVKLAKEGHIVGRIKGGDPFVFGRGGEEILALIKENIDFEVIPGVTSPVSVLSYAGIPITHRGIAQSFHIVTGMSEGVLNVNFEALAKENGTLVFMMGLANLNTITKKLIENGKNKDTLAAVIMRGTSSKQKKVVGTLENIEEKVKKANLTSPCIIVVGDVVQFSDKFNWYENKPLFGKNICITRSKKQSKNLKEKLYDLGAEVTEINSIKIESLEENLDEYLSELDTYDHIVFTSTNGVNIFFNYLVKKKYDIRKLKAKIYSVGKSTSKAIRDRGIQPYLTAKEFFAEALAKDMKNEIKENEKVLIPTSLKARNVIAEELEKENIMIHRVNIYDTVSGEIVDTRKFNEVDAIFFTSPSTVNNMISMLGIEKIKEKKLISIGPQTNKALKAYELDAYVCRKHNEDGFLEEIINIF